MQPADLVIIFVFIVVLGLAVTVAYGFIVGVPFVPTSPWTARSMVRLARLRGTEKVFDLGAGDGRILIELKRLHPAAVAAGYELSPVVYWLGRLTIFLSRQNIRFFRQDVRMADLRDADMIFLYLFPRLLQELEDKFDRELRPGTVVISNTFRFPRRQPVEVITLKGLLGKKTILRYEW